jgi:hypothetical protein
MKEKDKILNGNPYQNSTLPIIAPSHMNNSRLLNHNKKNDSSNFEQSIFSNLGEESDLRNEIGKKKKRRVLQKN